MRVRALMGALLTTAAFFFCVLGPAVAAPALWVVQSQSGGKIYLFGTVHLLRNGTQWRSPELDAAIKESQDLYLEIADPANVVAAASSLLTVGFDREHPLSSKISKDDEALLDAAARRYGLGTAATFEPMRPWLAFIMLAVMPAFHSGYSSSNGVDIQVRKEFAAAGKPIHGFETIEMQEHIFADLPESVQIGLLDAELKDLSRQTGTPGDAQLDRIVNAWLSGDQGQLAPALQDAGGVDKTVQASLYPQLLTNRNKAWANVLADRLKQPGTTFVCVGAAHLVGPGGVPALLAQMGYKVARVPIAQVAVAASPSPSVSPTAAASPTPIPQLLTPPTGWKPRDAKLSSGVLKTDGAWVDPNGKGVLISGHLEIAGMSGLDLETLNALVRQGIIGAAGAKGVGPSTKVKICGGKQDGILTNATLSNVKEEIIIAVSDRGYIAEYVRRADIAEDPAATRALLSLCTP